MSTRATYQFKRTEYKPTTTVYIHYDGYPEGAAVYFWNWINSDNQRGGGATAFIRANDNAELTESHEIHGDTEYRYTVSGDGPGAMLKCEARIDFTDQWRTAYSGPVWEFINKFGTNYIEDFQPLAPYTAEYGRIHYLTEQQAEKMAARLAEQAVYWYRRGATGNGHSYREGFNKLLDSLAANSLEKQNKLRIA